MHIKIQNVWISVTDNEHPDNNFKFKDYFLSVKKDIVKPVNYTDKVQIDKGIEDWKEPNIDLDKFLNTCPLIKK